MTELSIRDRLAACRTWAEVLEAGRTFWHPGGPRVFDTLFPLALSANTDPAAYNAGALLVFMDPDCNADCRALVEQVHRSQWWGRNREVAFYLLVHFGKEPLLKTCREFLATMTRDQQEESRVRALMYWTSCSAHELVVPFQAWMRGDTSVAGAGFVERPPPGAT